MSDTEAIADKFMLMAERAFKERDSLRSALTAAETARDQALARVRELEEALGHMIRHAEDEWWACPFCETAWDHDTSDRPHTAECLIRAAAQALTKAQETE